MRKYDIVIIGAGMAGLTAAIYARRAEKTVLILENKTEGGQIISSLKIGNWPGEKNISGPDLMEAVFLQAEDLGAEIEYEEVLEISKSAEFMNAEDAKNNVRALYNVRTDEAEYLAGAVIIATGTEPRKLSEKQTKDAEKRPISYCATCDGPLYKGKPVVVVGSGNTAKYEMEYLKNIASKVYHIHHDDPIPRDAEAVFVAIGRIPATGKFASLVNLDADGYIIAGEDCRTSAPGVFVAGDCRVKPLRQLVTSAADGAVAASGAVKYLM